MNGIFHKVGINAPAEAVYRALATQSGLANWWTKEVGGAFASGGEAQAGQKIHFGFGQHFIDMQVQTLEPANRVAWECCGGPDDWIGSHIEFNLRPAEGREMTLVYFRHSDWKTESDFTAHCSMKWAVFLLSLKNLIETGRGQPAPDDIKIDDWN
jgi:uncharacterized protein YndB with AHSA1/START domain